MVLLGSIGSKFYLCLFFLCLVRFEGVLQAYSQWSHLYGFSPV